MFILDDRSCRRSPWTITAAGVRPGSQLPAIVLERSCRCSSRIQLPVFTLDSGLYQTGFVLERSCQLNFTRPALFSSAAAGDHRGFSCRCSPWTITAANVHPGLRTLPGRLCSRAQLPVIALDNSSCRCSPWTPDFTRPALFSSAAAGVRPGEKKGRQLAG